MLQFDNLARKAIKLSASLLLSANYLFAQAPITSDLTNNATKLDLPKTRNWSLLQTDVTPNSFGAPVISRTTGTTTSACLDNSGATPVSATFSVSVPGLGNPVYTWTTIGGLAISGATTGSSVVVNPVKDPLSGKYFPGKLIVSYTGSTSATTVVPYTYNDCGVIKSGTTNYTVVTPQKGQASVNLAQKFTHNFPIVGPTCVSLNENVTYSVAPLVSSYEARDGYRWEQVAVGAGLLVPSNSQYNSLDNSSITGTVGSIPTSISVYVGACNQAASDKKTLIFGTTLPTTATIAQVAISGVVQQEKNPCVDAGITQVTLSVKNPDAKVDYLWSWDNSTFTLASGSLTGTTITLNIGGGAGKVFLKSTAKKQANVPVGQTAYCMVNNAPSFDEIILNRGYTSATVTSPNGTAGVTCVELGKTYTYAATSLVNGVTAPIGQDVNWTLPAGMQYEPNNTVQTTSSITVKVVSAVADGSNILGSIITVPGQCSGNITGLFNIKTAPNFTAVSGPNPTVPATTPNLTFCAAPGTGNVNYTAKAPVTAANPGGLAQYYDYISWTQTGGITGGGNAVYGANFPANFVSGTITGVAIKSGCPNSLPVTINVKSSANTGVLATLTTNKPCLNSGIADQVTLTTDAGYASYNWNIPAGWTVSSPVNEVIPNVAPQTGVTTNVNSVTFTTNGTGATVSVTGKNECSNTTAKSIILTANGVGQAVTITKTSVAGADILTGPYIQYATYEWYKNQDPLPLGLATGFSLQLTVASGVTNTYYLVVTLNSCKSKSTGTNPTSTYSNARIASDEESVETAEMIVSPNPAGSEFTLSLKGMIGAEVKVMNQTTGVIVKQLSAVGNFLTINTADWTSGVYVVAATSGTERIVKSIIIQH